MKKLTVLLVAIVATIATAVPAQAGFRVGPRVGIDVSALHFNSDLFASDNTTGFTGGVQAELSLPLGLGVDASLMYTRRAAKSDFINIPLNVKWNLGLPIIGNFLSPYIFTGPDFAFNVSSKAIKAAWNNKSVDVAWNFGLGLQFFSHLQVSAAYGLGITKYAHSFGLTESTKDQVSARNNNWTVTAAWLF